MGDVKKYAVSSCLSQSTGREGLQRRLLIIKARELSSLIETEMTLKPLPNFLCSLGMNNNRTVN